MIIYYFDGTENGLLTCLYHSFVDKEQPVLVTSGSFQTLLDGKVRNVETNDFFAERVRQGLIKYGAIALLNRLFYVFRSNDNLKENTIFAVAKKCLEHRTDYTFNFADPDVLQLRTLLQQIHLEVHRMYGFVRFEETNSNVWYAHFSPDNDICDLVAPHFLHRLGTQFILHDVKRNKATFCNGKVCITKQLTSPVTVYLSAKETTLKDLWQTYYNSVNIAQRKNLKLRNNYMPVRYHAHMPEMRFVKKDNNAVKK